MYNLDAHFFRCEMCIEMWNVQSNWGFRSNFFECYEFTLEAPSMAALGSMSMAMTTKCGPVSTSNINFANRGSTT